MPDPTADAELLAAAQVALNHHGEVLRRPRPAVRRPRARAVPRRRQCARCAARPARHRSGLHHRRPARADADVPARPWADALWDTGIDVRHGRRRQGRRPAGDHHLPRRQLRPGVAQPGGAVRRPPRRRPGAPRFHRQRDGGADHRGRARGVPRSARRPGRTARPGARHRRRRRRCRSATIRCGCCGRRGSSRSSASRWRRGCGGASRRWRRSWAGSPPSGSPPSWTRCCSATTRSPGST